MHDTVIARDEMYYMYIRQKCIQTICRIMELNAFFEIFEIIVFLVSHIFQTESNKDQMKSSHLALGQNPVSIITAGHYRPTKKSPYQWDSGVGTIVARNFEALERGGPSIPYPLNDSEKYPISLK